MPHLLEIYTRAYAKTKRQDHEVQHVVKWIKYWTRAAMKITKEINFNNRVRTLIECSLCGSTTHTNAGINTKTSKAAIERSCGACMPRNPLVN